MLMVHWAYDSGFVVRVPTVTEMCRAEAEYEIPDMVDEAALSQELVEQFLCCTTVKGSDIRLDTGIVMRFDAWPRHEVDVNKWQWKQLVGSPWFHKAHISELELRAVLSSLKWRWRHHKRRSLHLIDAQAVLGVVTNCRSSTFKLHFVIQKICALLLASGCLPEYAYIPTGQYPADRGSRSVRKVRKKIKHHAA